MQDLNQKVGEFIVSEIGKGALSGLAAAGGFLAGKFWDDLLLPWMQSTVFYSGVYLKTSYKGEATIDGKVVNDFIELKQKSGTVHGTMTTPVGVAGKYNFKGKILNNVLRGTFEGEGKTSGSKGSFLLEVKADSNRLEGWCLETIGGVIKAYEYKWDVRP